MSKLKTWRTLCPNQHPITCTSIGPSWDPPIWRRDFRYSWQENQDKVDELEGQLKQIKRIDSLGSVNFNDLCIHPDLKFPVNFKCPDFKKYDGKSCLYAHLKVYGVAVARPNTETMTNWWPNFTRSLTRATLIWFTKLEIAKIKKWIDLPHLFIDRYKFNSEISPDCEQLQCTSKKPSQSFREYGQRWCQTAL